MNYFTSKKTSLSFACIFSMLSLAPNIAHADKQDARDWYTGASAAGAAAALVPTGVTQAAGGGALAGQGIGLMGMGIWDWWNKAPANPNPNQQQQQQQQQKAPPKKAALLMLTPGVNATATEFAVVNSVNNSFTFANSLITDSRMVTDSLQRYYGALNSNDLVSAELQRGWASEALADLKMDITGYRNALLDINAAVQGTDFANIAVSISDIADLRTSIGNNGFPTLEQFVFDQTDASASEISLAIDEVMLASLTHLPSSGINGSNLFLGMSDSLGLVNLNELLPESFTPVPLPPAHTLMLSALAILGFYSRRRNGSLSA